MIPKMDIELAFAIVGGCTVAMSLFRRGSKEEDKMVSDAHDVVLDALSDADKTNVVEAINNRNWRDQISIEEALDMHEERELRRFENRN